MRQAGESLAGRMSLLFVSGLGLHEVRGLDSAQLWLRGGFPRAVLASSHRAAMRWLRDYLSLIIERDLPMLGLNVAAPVMHRFGACWPTTTVKPGTPQYQPAVWV